MRPLLIPATALALTACGQFAEAPPPPPADEPAFPLATAERTVAYTCERDLPITAIYGTNREGTPDVALIIRGTDIRLTQSVAASGARYTSPIGLEVGQGLAWWTKGDEALLQQAPRDQINDPEAATTIRSCRVKTEPDGAAAAPAPAGTPPSS